MTIKQLIKKITSYHPASEAGISRGWSYYIGGMADTGVWDYAKLLDAKKRELEKCLAELEEEWKPKAVPIYTEEEKRQMKTIIPFEDGTGFITEKTRNDFKSFYSELEYKMFGL